MDADVNAHFPLRPSGFRPAEISSLSNTGVIEQHVSGAAFLWTQREYAVCAPHYKLKHLARLDERTRAHLEGLRVAAGVGWQVAVAALEQGDAGNVFVVSYLAFASGDTTKMRYALELALSEPSFEHALEAALVWLDFQEVSSAVAALQRSAVADYQRVALAVLAGHGIDPGDALTRALESEDVRLRAWALRIIGQFKRRDLSTAARSCVGAADPVCQFWAGWALALVGYPDGAREALDVGLTQPGHRSSAVEMSMRFGAADWARQTVRALAGSAATLRLAIQAAAAFGDPAVVPWLLKQALEPKHARVAAEAFCMITGADLDYLGFKQDAPAEDSGESEPEDKELPWPDAQRLAQWWSTQQSRYVPGQRYLGGQPISVASGLEVLREGYQRQRRAAAIELARLNEAAPLFLVVDRADRQRRRLAT